MSRAEPMGAVERAHNYWLQGFRPYLTPRQERRLQHKANRARVRAVAAEYSGAPSVPVDANPSVAIAAEGRPAVATAGGAPNQ